MRNVSFPPLFVFENIQLQRISTSTYRHFDGVVEVTEKILDGDVRS